jgi:hypothetical protein
VHLEHQFAVVVYFKEARAEEVKSPENVVTVSTERYGYCGANIVPIQLLFARFLPYKKSDRSFDVVPYLKKWFHGTHVSIKPKYYPYFRVTFSSFVSINSVL